MTKPKTPLQLIQDEAAAAFAVEGIHPDQRDRARAELDNFLLKAYAAGVFAMELITAQAKDAVEGRS